MSHFKRFDPFLLDPFSSSSNSSCPFLSADFTSRFAPPLPPPSDALFSDPLDLFDDLDLLLPNPNPNHFDLFPDPYLAFLTERVAALEHAISAPPPPPPRRKYTSITESGNRKLKYTVEDKGFGERTLKYEAEVKSPLDEEGVDRKWKWEAKTRAGGEKKAVTYGKEVKGKGWLEPWSQSYTWEEVFDDEEEEEKKGKKVVVKKKEEKKRAGGVRVVEIEDNVQGAVAMRKDSAVCIAVSSLKKR